MVGKLYAVFLKLVTGAFLTFGTTVALAEYTWNFPDPVTPMALDTLHVHNKFMLICIAIFLLVLAIMIYSIVVHRKDKEFKASTFTGPGNGKQVFWTLVPFLVLLYIDFILMGIPAWHAVVMMEDTKTDAQMVVRITASQWRWKYEYPEEGIEFVSALSTPANQIDNSAPKGKDYLLEVDHPMVLPINKKIRFMMTSSDVVHEWWVPAFGAKRNAVPGFVREIWATIEKPGVYRGQCTELCGLGHGFMPIVVEAVTEEKYREWVASKKVQAQSTTVSGNNKEVGAIQSLQVGVPKTDGEIKVAAAN